MPFISNAKDDPEQSQYIIGFPKGLDTVQDPSLVNDKNLILAQNVQLAVDGIERRFGSTKPFLVGGNKVYGSSAFYKKTDGTIQEVFIANGRLCYRVAGSTTINVVNTHTFSNVRTTFVQARDKLFIYNGIDPLRYWNGSVITQYTSITTPAGLAVAAQGAAGSTPYSYRVSAFNATGETLACTAVAIANGNAVLSTTNFNKLDWTATAGATGYNIFGRTAAGFAEVYLATVYTNTYNDTGIDIPVTSHLPQDSNNTGGIVAKAGIFTLGRQFVIGVYEGAIYYPTRMYYSGTLNYVDSFVGGQFGGGWVDVYSNDGGELVDLMPYQNGVLLFKTNGLFKFYFTSTGLPALQEITRGHGGVSSEGSQAIDNDIVYVAQKENRISVMTVGQQQNYVGDQLRTNEISVFIQNQLTSINRSLLSNIASFLYDSKFGFTYTSTGATENAQGYVVDTRFGGWVYWTGDPMKCTHYGVYDDGTNVHLYGGSNRDGYMIELFKTDRNDNNATFTSIVGTKQYNGNQFDVQKIWRNPTLWFKYIAGGSISVEVWADGTRKQGTAALSALSSGSGPGGDLAGAFLAGGMASTTLDTTVGSDTPEVLTLLTISRSIGFYLIDSGLNTNWLFMGIHLMYTPLGGKPLEEKYRVEVT